MMLVYIVIQVEIDNDARMTLQNAAHVIPSPISLVGGRQQGSSATGAAQGHRTRPPQPLCAKA